MDQKDMVTVIEAVQWDFEPGLVVLGVHEVCDETLCLRWSENSTSPLANKVVKSEFTADIDARIDEVFSIYESRSKSFSWWIGPHSRPVDLRNRLERRAMWLEDEYVGLAFRLDAFDTRLDGQGWVVEDAVTDEQLRGHATSRASVGFSQG